MKVSRHWLTQYVDINLTDVELAHRLTMAGLEVESVESRSEGIAGIVVGEVLSVEAHPNAKKLTVCRVFDGRAEAQVVCGAPNVTAGQKVAFAPEGSSVPRNQHDPEAGPLRIGRVVIRGVESAGMICSGFELALSDDHEGILILDAGAKPGTPLARHLDLEDTLLDIGVTANRPDLLSHVGIAREIAAATSKRLTLPRVACAESKEPASERIKVSIEDPAACPRYAARVVEDVTVGPSPAWLRDALLSIGLRPVNNVVDVTNYVLMEIGHPLHAFDHARIAGQQIIVRTSGGGEKFTTLDGKTREIAKGTLLIGDRDGALAIAGVMGGMDSEITHSTKTVVLESAYFEATGIRRTSKRLGLSTEASQRFERGADPNAARWAVDRAAGMLAEVAGGKVLKGVVDRYPSKIKERQVRLDARKCSRLLGVTIAPAKISTLLKSIGLKKLGRASAKGDLYAIPTWRPDLAREVDLIEEAARLFGYDNIMASPRVSVSLRERAVKVDLADLLRDYLSSAGFREIVTNSMGQLSDAVIGTREEAVTIANPLSADMAALRTSLLPGLLGTVKHNLFHGASSSRFYEIGTVFARNSGVSAESLDGYREETRLCIGLYGLESPVTWSEKPKNATVFTMKGEADALLRRIPLDNPRYIPYRTPTTLSERPILLELNGEVAGTLGSVSTALRKRFDIDTEVFFLDVSLDVLRRSQPAAIVYKPYPRFPVVYRDIAVMVDEGTPIGEIEKVIRSSAGPLLKEIILFDVYAGEQVGKGKKSCAFSLEFVPGDRTLEQQEIQGLIAAVTESLSSSLGAVLRQ